MSFYSKSAKTAGMCIVLLLSLISSKAFSESSPAIPGPSTLNMPVGVTPLSHSIYTLHMSIFYICVAIGCLVFGVLIYSLFKFRKSKGAVPANFHEHTLVELIWTIIPFLILIAMAIPATKVLIEMNDFAKPELTIKVTGYQWKWKYDYLDSGISFFSNMTTTDNQRKGLEAKSPEYLREVDNPLVLPAGLKVRFLITSNDVIHAWWMPDFAVKKDAIPGFIQESWAKIEETGTYTGQCSVLCGQNHGFMPIVVKVVTPDEFKAWEKEQVNAAKQAASNSSKTFTRDELMKTGQVAYEKTCAGCHQVTGAGMPPAFPALKGGKIAVGPVGDHINIVLNGKPGTAMQAFGAQLNDADLAAIITYERNAWGNDDQAKHGKDAGGLVQPGDVAKERVKK